MCRLRLVERESGKVLRDGIEDERQANELLANYEDGDLALGVFTESFYDIEKY